MSVAIDIGLNMGASFSSFGGGETPWRRPNRQKLIRDTLRQQEMKRCMGFNDVMGFSGKLTVPGTTCHNSTIPLLGLAPITLSSMFFPKVHRGFYILCRTVTPATHDVGVNVIIEDTAGDVTPAGLYNMQVTAGSPDHWLPQGTIFIVKEPFLKMSAAMEMLIRVESPSDVIFLRPDDPLLRGTPWCQPTTKSFDELKAQGNAEFEKRKYEDAIHFYDLALELKPDGSVVHSNKAQALLCLSRFFEARRSAQKALANEDSEVNQTPRLKMKALFRRGQASYGLRDWTRAIEEFENIETNYPDAHMAGPSLTRARQRVLESQTGNYQMAALAPTFGHLFKHDVADYIGPVEIVDIPEKGKGLIVTANVREGTLLLASKAFAIAESDHNEHLVFDTPTLLLAEVTRMLQNNPHRTSEFYQLDSGKLSREPIPNGTVDIDRINAISEINHIIIENELDGHERSSNLPCGLWILPSFINHSCTENVIRTVYGDLMIVRALRDLQKGEEIVYSYCLHLQDPRYSKEYLSQLPFKCRCAACLEEESTDPIQLTRRVELFAKLMAMNPRWSRGTDLQQIVRNIEATYRKSDCYRSFLLFPLLAVADAAMREGEGEFGLMICRRMLTMKPRMALHGDILVRLKIANIQYELGGMNASKPPLTELLDFIEKRTGLNWVHLKQLAKDIIEAGDPVGRLTPVLDSLHQSRE
jgi:tetratricopeptide (TPR) repeat protein